MHFDRVICTILIVVNYTHVFFLKQTLKLNTKAFKCVDCTVIVRI